MTKTKRNSTADRRKALATDIGMQANRLTYGHHPVAVLVSCLEALSNYAAVNPLSGSDIDAALAEAMNVTGYVWDRAPMGQPVIVLERGAKPLPYDDAIDALRDLVKRCDGDAGVRADGSNIDTCRARYALERFPEDA